MTGCDVLKFVRIMLAIVAVAIGFLMVTKPALA